jgi:peroxiredoxin (alkyl hydroperoxide reductase subunit C)
MYAINKRKNKMKTIGDKLNQFSVVGVKPARLDYAEDAFETLTEKSFPGKWKVIVFYPKDFTFVCPTEIVAYDKLSKDFDDRDAVLMTGSTDNEFCKIAWRNAHEDLAKTNSWSFADQIRGWQWNDEAEESTSGLAEQLGILTPQGVALRATFIVDPENIIQHVTVNNLDVGRNPEETLRILDALQTGELCACNRTIGGETL